MCSVIQAALPAARAAPAVRRMCELNLTRRLYPAGVWLGQRRVNGGIPFAIYSLTV
jgi:hypothetical protein